MDRFWSNLFPERDSGERFQREILERERTCGEVLGGQLGGLLRILRIREDQQLSCSWVSIAVRELLQD